MQVSHLSACLGEALAPQASAIRVAVWTALDHREYAVRFEAATAIAALLQALPGQVRFREEERLERKAEAWT